MNGRITAVGLICEAAAIQQHLKPALSVRTGSNGYAQGVAIDVECRIVEITHRSGRCVTGAFKIKINQAVQTLKGGHQINLITGADG